MTLRIARTRAARFSNLIGGAGVAASVSLASFAGLATYGCSSSVTGATATDAGPNGISGGGVGASCDPSNACRAGLSCDPATTTCTPAGTSGTGTPCVIGDECTSGVCGADGQCAAAGTGALGGACAGDADCGRGLRCGFDGANVFPRCIAEGTGDYGATCTAWRDCRQGLVCASGGCRPPTVDPTKPLPHGIPPFVTDPTAAPWSGATCPTPNATGPVTALFEIPRAGVDIQGDFYRLPFPNDAARVGGKVSFAQHPHYAVPEIGVDLLQSYLTALETEPFGAYSTVYFRFDGPFDFASVDPGKKLKNLKVVNLTAGPAFGVARGLNDFVTDGRNKYICDNYLAVRPNRGDPYAAGTYAVIMTTGAKARSDGLPIKQAPDFAAMVAPSAPSDAALVGPYAAYKPLRDYMLAQKLAPTDVTVATVFTVGEPKRIAAELRPAVRAAKLPTFSPWVKCGVGVTSPCAQADGARACTTDSPDFIELQSLVEIPIFQRGPAPYVKAPDGAMDTASGALTALTTTQVCASLTIPKGVTPPAAGFPIAIYAHGTGGSFRSHTLDGSAKLLSKIPIDGKSYGFAVLGIDQVEHGPRRGSSTASPNDLFFNFVNASAARYNALQGAADQHALVRALEGLTGIDASVAGAAIKLDPKSLVYWGHSQGATEGALFLAYDTSVKGAVLSGEGGGLIDALTTKTSPVDIKDSMWLALGEDNPGAVFLDHPVLSLLQAYIDPSDPIHFATFDSLAIASSSTSFARNVFQPWGTQDTFTPWETQAGYALASTAFGNDPKTTGWVGPIVDPGTFGTSPPPTTPAVKGNVKTATAAVTVAFRQYAPIGYDGHFVAFRDAAASIDVAKFLARSALGQTPQLPE